MKRTGCLYSEWTSNGKHPSQGGLRNPGAVSRKFRWVAEFSYHGKRYRFRSTCFGNVVRWKNDMAVRFSD